MATRKTSQAQQTPAANPFTSLPGMDVWKSMIEAQNQRFEQMLGELERLEKERHDRSVAALDDVSKLMKSTLEYQNQLNAQWRDLGLEATRKGLAMMSNASES